LVIVYQPVRLEAIHFIDQAGAKPAGGAGSCRPGHMASAARLLKRILNADNMSGVEQAAPGKEY
jgi:hypothetical protein